MCLDGSVVWGFHLPHKTHYRIGWWNSTVFVMLLLLFLSFLQKLLAAKLNSKFYLIEHIWINNHQICTRLRNRDASRQHACISLEFIFVHKATVFLCFLLCVCFHAFLMCVFFPLNAPFRLENLISCFMKLTVLESVLHWIRIVRA